MPKMKMHLEISVPSTELTVNQMITVFADRRTYCYLEPGLVQAGKRSGGPRVAEILCADEYVKAGYQILVELARQKEPQRSKVLRKSVQTLRENYQRHLTSTDEPD